MNDTLVNRVSNWDTTLYHVTDIELLSSYKPKALKKPLPLTVLFENEKTVAIELQGPISAIKLLPAGVQ